MAIDRPGYGKSYLPDHSLSLSEQAKILNKYLKDNFPNKKIILVGHSYGSSLVAKMAADPKGAYSSIFLFSAFADPEYMRKDWKVKRMRNLERLAESRIGPWIFPNTLISARRELTRFEEDTRLLMAEWKKIDEKVYVIHGENDTSAVKENGPLIKSLIGKPRTKVSVIKGAKHRLFNKNADEVASILLQEL